jgi:hypothetical protein
MSLYVARSSAIAARALDDEMIVMSTRDSTLFTLNEVAAAIWQVADGATPLDEIVRSTVCEKFDIDFETACRDAEEYCRALASHGVLVVSESPIPSTAA